MPWNFSILSTVIMCRSIRYFQFLFFAQNDFPYFLLLSLLSRKHAVHHHVGTNALARNEIVNISSESMKNSGLKKEDWKMGRKRIKYKVRWSVCVVCNLKFIKHSNLLRSFFDPNATAMECDSKWNAREKNVWKKYQSKALCPTRGASSSDTLLLIRGAIVFVALPVSLIPGAPWESENFWRRFKISGDFIFIGIKRMPNEMYNHKSQQRQMLKLEMPSQNHRFFLFFSL